MLGCVPLARKRRIAPTTSRDRRGDGTPDDTGIGDGAALVCSDVPGGCFMKVVFDACVPPDEVLKGELREDMFAAKLNKVLLGQADPIYQDAKRFFENTFVTDGLRTLVR